MLFRVEGPYEVPLHKGNVFQDVADEQLWNHHPHLRDAAGCYVFAVERIRKAGEYLPVYVGLTKRTFQQECFDPAKTEALNRFLLDSHYNRLFLFLVVHPIQPGRLNLAAIGQAEKTLIRLAVLVNPNLLNVQGTHPESWGIQGVLRSGPGKQSSAAQALQRTLGLAPDAGSGEAESTGETGPAPTTHDPSTPQTT